MPWATCFYIARWTACRCPCITSEFRGCWTRLPATLRSYVHATMWHCRPAFSALAADPSAYTLQTVFLCMVPLTGMHQTTSPIWLHWHQLRRAGHIFALPTASASTSLGCGRRWAIVHSRSLVHAPGTHFLLTFVLHPAWTPRSVSTLKSHLFCYLRAVTTFYL